MAAVFRVDVAGALVGPVLAGDGDDRRAFEPDAEVVSAVHRLVDADVTEPRPQREDIEPIAARHAIRAGGIRPELQEAIHRWGCGGRQRVQLLLQDRTPQQRRMKFTMCVLKTMKPRDAAHSFAYRGTPCNRGQY